ncbi:MAG: restriction endonuclease subunit S [Proteobacteria bacterium]|nr:MAG: restriction endonuclease subunit S [Pseudomonadota bacterium]
MKNKNLIQKLGFLPKENTSGIFIKKYTDDYAVELDFEKELINYGDRITAESKTTQNFSQAENWVVLECVNRLLEQGYKPENIILEKTWASGHGTSGRLDVCVIHDDGSEYLLIECKTWGKEFEKELAKMKKDGGQLFTYFKFSNKADVIMLYASQLNGDVLYRNEIIKIEDDYRTGDVKDFYDKWNKITKDNGVFDDWVAPYHFISKALTPKLLEPIKQEDSGFIFNRFLEILRHNVVSDKPNAFNKIFTLFLCKVYDEKSTRSDEELKFQWLEGKDDDVSFQLRLADLYKNGMLEFLEKEVTDFSTEEFDKKYKHLDESIKKDLLADFFKLRLEKNNEFAIKEVFDKQSFTENAKIVKEVVELLQGFRIRYNKRQQYLSDFFELLLTTGLKQESGQFFTPVPIAQFIIKSLPLDTMVNERLEKGERNHLLPYIMDYAAGSGHFLTESMHEIQRLLDQKQSNDYISGTGKKIKTWQDDHFDWATQYVYGIEKDYRLVKVGKVGCYLHGDGLANVILSDGLANFENEQAYKGVLKKSDKDFPKENKQFDIVISNPPYSVSSFKNAAREYYNENDFDLYSSLTDNSSEIECLFIERTKQLLKDGGIAGIILPSSILSNSGIYSKAREIILQNFEIIAIAELGSNTFMATGTNTVTLFLRRRNNYVSINLKKSVENFFTNLQDVTLHGIENPVSKYVAHVWEGITLDDYKTLLQKSPNQAIKEHEIYQEYQKKIKAKKEADKWQIMLDLEAEKLLYFISAYPQKLVLVKTGQKKEEKQFLGYEFSNRRGSEGIHPIQRGKSIDACTSLFDSEVFDNPEKASTYIYKAFEGEFDFPIDESLKNNVTRINLVDMMTFDRVDFEKNLSLIVKKKVTLESKWKQTKLESLATLIKRGKSAKYGKSDIQIIKSGQARGLKKFEFKEKHFVAEGFSLDERKLEKGDLLINSSGVGTAGRVTLFELNGIFVADNHITILRLDRSQVLPEYALSCFAVIGFKNLENLALGQSGQIEMTIDTIENIKIPLPPKAIQEKIVAEFEVLENREKDINDMLRKAKQEVDSIIAALKIFDVVDLGSVSENLDNLREPVTKGHREKGNIPYYGASGVVDYVADFLLDDYVLLVSEDGANLKARVSPIAFTVQGKIWVNNHAHILKFDSKVTHKIIELLLNRMDISEHITGQAQPKLNQKNLHNIKVPLPPLSEQQKIVTKIETIEAKIESLEKETSAIPAQKEAILKKYLE